MTTALVTLRAFQIARLEDTFHDLPPELVPLGKFFIHDLYGRADPPGREETVRRVYKAIEDRLGGDAIAGLRRLLRLYQITKQMDAQLAAMLEPTLTAGALTGELYEAAYRDADAYDLRREQIDLIVEAIEGVHKLARSRGVGKGLKALSWIAAPLGAKPLVEFLTRGWEAFHSVEDVTVFTALIRERETRRLDRIYGRG